MTGDRQFYQCWYATGKLRDYSPLSQCLPLKPGSHAHV